MNFGSHVTLVRLVFKRKRRCHLLTSHVLCAQKPGMLAGLIAGFIRNGEFLESNRWEGE